MPSVASSQRVAAYLQEQGIKIVHLDGKSSEEEVQQAKEDFEAGNIQVISSCDKMTQSWDSDTIDGVINLRPTLSPSKYFQIIGRALHGKEIVE
jgi:superfamily II DNA or RNA helicase